MDSLIVNEYESFIDMENNNYKLYQLMDMVEKKRQSTIEVVDITTDDDLMGLYNDTSYSIWDEETGVYLPF